MATFDRSPFKLFSLRFLAKSVQALSNERLKTTQRTLFLSFEIKNCFPITVLPRSFMKKSGKLTCHVVNKLKHQMKITTKLRFAKEGKTSIG